MAMCESLHSTSPLPSPEQKPNNPNVSAPLNSYITHPTGAGPRDPPDHTGGLQDLVKNPLESYIVSSNTACHSYCPI